MYENSIIYIYIYIYSFKDKDELEQAIIGYPKNINTYYDCYYWYVSKITDMSYLFYNIRTPYDSDYDDYYNFDDDDDADDVYYNISHWDVSNVTKIDFMFASNFNGNITDWDVDNVISMNGMFTNSIFNGDISKWNVENVNFTYFTAVAAPVFVWFFLHNILINTSIYIYIINYFYLKFEKLYLIVFFKLCFLSSDFRNRLFFI